MSITRSNKSPRGNKTNTTFHEDFEESVEYEMPKKRQTNEIPKTNQKSDEFQIPKKCHTTKVQSPKPPWEPIDLNLNRYAVVVHPSIEPSYATVVKETSKLQKTKKDAEQNLHTRKDKISDKARKVQTQQVCFLEKTNSRTLHQNTWRLPDTRCERV